MFDIEKIGLDKLNSLTKYPSIPTYHQMDDRGVLLDALRTPFPPNTVLRGTEKVDGTNSRIIFTPDQRVIVASREELLWAKGDLIVNPTTGIVENLRSIATDLHNSGAIGRMSLVFGSGDNIIVLYGEHYGKGVGDNPKQYTTRGRNGYRLFDVVVVEHYEEILGCRREQIATWRDSGGQIFLSDGSLLEAAAMCDLDLVPSLFAVPSDDFPVSLDDTIGFMSRYTNTRAGLDPEQADQPAPLSEGIVVRNDDRSVIAKLRYQDYARKPKKQRKPIETQQGDLSCRMSSETG